MNKGASKSSFFYHLSFLGAEVSGSVDKISHKSSKEEEEELSESVRTATAYLRANDVK